MESGHTYRALALLLSYPGQSLLDHLSEIEQALRADPRLHRTDRVAMYELLDLLLDRDPMDSESAYLDTFERGSAASLNLFEHVHGDSRDRGQAMVDLLALYDKHGLDLAISDLPDHLPVFLEFLSLLEADEAQRHLQEVQHLLLKIGATLTRRKSPYAAVFRMLLRLAGDEAPEQSLAPCHEAPVEEDTTAEAIDKAWLDQPVSFLGSCSPNRNNEQIIQFQRRTA